MGGLSRLMHSGALRVILAVLAGVVALGAAPQPVPAPTPTPAVGPIPAARQARNVAIITIDRPIDGVLAASVARRMELAQRAGADAIVFDLDTPGGEIDAVLRISAMIKRSPIPNTVAWINSQAYSGGAIIALACREIVVAEYAAMGDAAPVAGLPGLGLVPGGLDETERQKLLVPLLADVVDSARRRGYDEKLVQGMLTRGVELWLVENRATGQRLFIDRAEFETLFDQPPPAGSPTLPSAPGGPPATAQGPDAQPAQTVPAAPPAGAPGGAPPSGTDFIPASPGFSPALVKETSGAIGVESQRPVLTRADRGQWALVEYVADGRGLVTMSDRELTRYGFAAGTVRDDEELRAFFGASAVRRLDESWSERLVSAMTGFIVRAVLLVIFLLALFLVLTHPGAILPETVAAVALIALLAPPMLIGMAAWWEVAAIILGIVLLAAEIFIFPGFGIPGVLGLLCLFGGLVGTFAPQGADGLFPDTPAGREDLFAGVVTVALSTLVAAGGMYAIARNIGSLPVVGRLILKDPVRADESGDDDMLAAMQPEDALRPGMRGRAVTPLRPAGKADIEGRIADVVSDLGFVGAGTPVRVTSVTTFRVVVEPIPADPPDAAGPADGARA